jgi:hypothetical protein
MKGTDRFLITLVAGMLLLVGLTFGLALLRPNRPAYQADDTPEGVVNNYLLAIQRGDHSRAYGYLSPKLRGYPADAERFAADVDDNRWSFGYYDDDVSLAIEKIDLWDDKATVSVRKTSYYRGGLFDNGQYSTSFRVTLHHEDGAWKILDSDRYWANCWDWTRGCR